MGYQKDWSTVMVQLMDYFETTKVPRTVSSALKELGVKGSKSNRTHVLKILRKEFPDEMRALEHMHYCIPPTSRGSLVSGYFFVKYKDEFIRYIEEDMSMDKIYYILMQDPRNKNIDITKEKFIKDVYAHLRAGSAPDIKKAQDERKMKKHKRLDEIYLDVMTSRPYKYTVAAICEKYNMSKTTLYTLLKHTEHGKELKKRLDYKEYVNCTTRARLIKLSRKMMSEGISTKDIAEHFGVSEAYIKYTTKTMDNLDEKLSKIEV